MGDTFEPGNGTQWRSRSGLLNRIRSEYLKMPGLRLTTAQAGRLFDVDRDLCCGLMVALVGAGFLAQTSDGRYVRRG